MNLVIINDVENDTHLNTFLDEVSANYPEVIANIISKDRSFDLDSLQEGTVLVVFFHSKNINHSYDQLITAYAKRFSSAANYLVISCGEEFYPDGILSKYKAIKTSEDKSLQNIIRRLGAFLGLINIPKDNDIFISYRVTDGKDAAVSLHKHFDSLGYNVWRDEHRDEDNEGNIKIGEDVQQIIRQAIVSSNLVILIDTKDALNSPWIKEEIEYANANLIPVIPLCIRTNHTKGSHFRSLRSLNRYIDSNPELSNMDQIVFEVEDFLKDVYLRRKRLPIKVERNFVKSGFTWDAHHTNKLLFNSQKSRKFGLTRILSHLPIYEGLHSPLINQYVKIITEIPQKCNENVYIYDTASFLTDDETKEIFKENNDAVINNVRFLHHQQIEEFLKSHE